MVEKTRKSKIARERIRLMEVAAPPSGLIEADLPGHASGILSDIMDWPALPA
jgi:hypothetical protein